MQGSNAAKWFVAQFERPANYSNAGIVTKYLMAATCVDFDEKPGGYKPALYLGVGPPSIETPTLIASSAHSLQLWLKCRPLKSQIRPDELRSADHPPRPSADSPGNGPCRNPPAVPRSRSLLAGSGATDRRLAAGRGAGVAVQGT